LSISPLIKDNNIIVEFSSNSYFIKDQVSHRIPPHKILHKELYQTVSSDHQDLQVSQAQPSADLWHFKLAHCSNVVLDKLKKAHLISVKPSSSLSFYSDCNKAKTHKLPFLPSKNCANKPLQIVHSDLWGPTPIILTNEN
jgi:GAG-pre-integrase domain